MDLAQLYMKAGVKSIGTVFLLTDAQVPDERFLVLINDLLASGEIPGLFADDEFENVISGVRNEVKGAGIQDTKENCWRFFIDRVRRQLKVNKLMLIDHSSSGIWWLLGRTLFLTGRYNIESTQ